MKIKILFIVLVSLFFISNLWAFSVSEDKKYPFRIYIGENKNIDCIDVVSVGYFFNGEYKILFEDKSPIEEIYLDENMLGEKFYWIVKGKSIWKFFDEGIESRLHLVEPVIPKDQNPVLIYKKH